MISDATLPPSSMLGDHERVVEWLRQPQTYVGHPTLIETIETHISCVFLCGDRVLKLKKPLQFDFVDFSTVERREQACRDEVRLNRRLAGEVYRGVRAVTQTVDGGYEFDGPGKTVDWVVEMQRLPDELMLDHQIRCGTLCDEDTERLGKFLAQFYAASPGLTVAPEVYLENLLRHVQANRQSLLDACSDPVQRQRIKRIHTSQLRMLWSDVDAFLDRVRRGRIVDGHGDLRPEHICLLDRPVVFDCVEFSAELRQIDALDELCFLAVECDRLRAERVGTSFLGEYGRTCDDPMPVSLIAFYKSYRAVVRAKVAALRACQAQGDLRYSQFALAENYLRLAERYLRNAGARPLLLIICGLMGSGKSTLAQTLSDRIAAELIRTDVVRDELLPASTAVAAFGEGRYQPELRDQVYHEVLHRAAELLDGNLSVLLDGTYALARDREAAIECGHRRGAEVFVVECVCPQAISMERIERRRRAAHQDASEARTEHYEQQRRSWEPHSNSATVLKIDSSQPIQTQFEQIMNRLSRLGCTS